MAPAADPTDRELRRELSSLRRERDDAQREARELRAGLEGSPVAGEDVANRTSLSKLRNRTYQRLQTALERWFDEVQRGDWEQALFDGVSVVLPDLATVQLTPSLNPDVVGLIDDLRRMVSDPAIAAGMASAARGGADLGHVRDDAAAALAQVYRRSNWAVFEESTERFDEKERRE